MRRQILLAATLIAAAAAPVAAQPIPLDTVRAGAASRLVAGAAALTRSIVILERTDIEALPARNVADVLSRVMGVDLQARSAAQADLSLRGSSFEQVLVLVDGIPVNDDQTGHFHMDLAVPLDAVERIEVLLGPASAVYGSSAVGGVVNVVTRRAAPEVSVRAQGGSFGAAAFAVDAGTRFGIAGVRASAEHDRSDGHREGTDHRITQARLGVDAGAAGGELRGDVAWAARDFGADAFYAPFDSYEETRTFTAALSWRSRPARWTVEPRVSLRSHEDDFVLRRGDPAFYRNIHTGRQTVAELVVRGTLGHALRAAFGTDAARSELESTNLGDRSENRLAAFAEIAAGTGTRTLLTAGLRLDRHSTFGTFLSPSVAIGHRIAGPVRLRASAAAGYRAPSFTDRFYEDPANIGDPDLDAERFRTAEVGAVVQLNARTLLDLAVFVRDADDLIDWGRHAGAPASEPWRTMNVERATFTGLESALRVDLAPLRITGRLELLDVDARPVPGFSSKYALRPLTRSAALVAALDLPLGAAAAFHVAHNRRAAAGDDAPAESWNLIDLRIARAAGPVHLFADVTNLTDATYLDVSARPAPGRAIGFGVRVRPR